MAVNKAVEIGVKALILKLDGSGNKVWTKVFGGSNYDMAYSVRQTMDGGYIAAGRTTSAGAGSLDVLVFKLDGSGNKMWAKTFGGIYDDSAYSVQQTSDGGYVVAGETNNVGEGSSDVLVLKLDGSGNKVWAKVFGGSYNDMARSVQQTTDGEYIVGGYTTISAFQNTPTALFLKLDGSGNKVWAKTLETAGIAYSTQQTTDGGYIAAGWTWDYSTGVSINSFLILKLDDSGNKVWAKTFGGGSAYYNLANSVQQTTDGGCIVAGWTSDYPITPSSVDVLVLKLDGSGNKVWAKTFGDAGYYDAANSVQQAADGGYIVAGFTNSAGIDTGALVLKLDASGSLRAGCWGQDVAWQTVDKSLTLVNVSWITQNATFTLVSADTLILADYIPTVITICPRAPKKTPDDSSSLGVILGAIGGGVAAISAVGFWQLRKKVLAHRREKASPFANRIHHALNLGISGFQLGEGLKFVQAIDTLATELLDKQEIDINTLAPKELQELSGSVAMAVKQHTTLRPKGCRMFRSYAIDCEEVRSKIDIIAQDVATAWRGVATSDSDSVPIPLQDLAADPVIEASTTVTRIP